MPTPIASITEEDEETSSNASSDGRAASEPSSTTSSGCGVDALRQFCSTSIAIKETKKQQLEQRRVVTEQRKTLRRQLTDRLAESSETVLYLAQTNEVLTMKKSRSLKNVNTNLLEQCVRTCAAAEPHLLTSPPPQAAKQLFAQLQSLRATFHHYADTELCTSDPSNLVQAPATTVTMVEEYRRATAQYKELQAAHKRELVTLEQTLRECTPHVSTFMQQKRTRSQRVHLSTADGGEATFYVRTKQRRRKDQTKKFLMAMFERAITDVQQREAHERRPEELTARIQELFATNAVRTESYVTLDKATVQRKRGAS